MNQHPNRRQLLGAAGAAIAASASPYARAATRPLNLKTVLELNLGEQLGQLRAAPVSLGAGAPKAFLVAHAPDFDIDPWEEMLFIPKGTLKIAVVTADGKRVWSRDLGRPVLPGIWFCPVFPMDLDGDGVDEIWFVDNVDPVHPFSHRGRKLARLNAATGELMGHYPWPAGDRQGGLSHLYRNFIFGGEVGAEPVLITAQGTYGEMKLQAWNSSMKTRWEKVIARDAPGARGSHMTPIASITPGKADATLWGERLIRLDNGEEMFCAERDSYKGHSDVIQPFYVPGEDSWWFFTCRESDPQSSPRVAVYNSRGERVWGDLDRGHIDMGWVARRTPEGHKTSMAIRIGSKTLGPDGREHQGTEEFVYDALTGKKETLPFSVYRTIPVDLNGDGQHELVRGVPGGDGAVFNWSGEVMAKPGGTLAMGSKFLDLPGEQILMFTPDGTIRVWADTNAEDSEHARKRYAHPLYVANQRLTANGYNLVNLGGI